MKILIVTEHFPSLSETFVLDQVLGLRALGHDVVVYSLGAPSGSVQHEEYQYADWNKIHITAHAIPKSKIRRLYVGIKIFANIFRRVGFKSLHAFNVKRHGRLALNLRILYTVQTLANISTDFDIIHCHFGDKGVVAQTWLDMGIVSGRLSVVFHAHELCNLTRKQGHRYYSCLFKSGALLLPISKYWAELLLDWGATKNRLTVHHMGIDTDYFSFQKRVRRKKDNLRILSVGRLSEQKGHRYLIAAIKDIITKYGDRVKLQIIGEGELLEQLMDQSETLGVSDSVIFSGARTRTEVRHSLYAADIFVLPSVKGANGLQEGIPVALMEAMSSGLPVIATKHSGIPELIEDGFSGVLVEEKNTSELSTAIIQCMENPATADSHALNARRKVSLEFSSRVLIDELQSIFLREISS